MVCTASMFSTLPRKPSLMARTGMSSRMARACSMTSAVSAVRMSLTERVSFAVTAVMMGVQWQPRLAVVSMSACMPALPDGSWLDRLMTTGVSSYSSFIACSWQPDLGLKMKQQKSKFRARSTESERLQFHQENYAQQEQHRKFVEPAVKDVAASILAAGKLLDESPAIDVIGEQQDHQADLAVHPAGAAKVVPAGNHQRQAEQ